MYRIVTVKTKAGVPPTRFGMPLQKGIKESIAEKYERVADKRYGVGLVVLKINEIGEGKITAGDASVYYPVTFDLLVYKPEIQEVVVGDVVDNTEFSAFVRIGPLDGLVHVSQILDDFINYDERNSIFSGRDTKKTLKEGDSIIGRIISLNLVGGKENKIGLTMRQPGLGSVNWIEDEKKKATKVVGAKK
ncbi:MAG: DNA-directed RNA polymerase [Candidatus Aenigmarchaeota archaeon]|nr:DNA-directed RNA polymerase [Candidatus Aenigmarchaeota archaeon]